MVLPIEESFYSGPHLLGATVCQRYSGSHSGHWVGEMKVARGLVVNYTVLYSLSVG